MDLLTDYKKISDVERKIAEARLAGLSLSQLDVINLIPDLLNTLISISVISGHSLPEQEFLAQRLNEELMAQLLEYGYADLTIAEIVLAFRLNCQSSLRYPSGAEVSPVDIFGKFVSVDYITKVLNVYLTFRKMLDNQLKNIVDGY